jgi:D-alanine-D-alanine ligase
MPLLLPHLVTGTLLVSYPDEKDADAVEQKIRDILAAKGVRCQIERLSNRPPMKERRANIRLARQMTEVAQQWEIPLHRESSVWPSVGGLAPAATGVICGVGPVARKVYMPEESVDRISMMQRTLLLAEILAKQGENA